MRHYDRRQWRTGGDGRVRTPRPEARCKRSVNVVKKCRIHLLSRRWNSQNLWERAASENIHFNPGSSGTRRRTRNSSRKIRWITPSNSTSRRLNTGWSGSKKWLLVYFKRIHLSPSRCILSQIVRADRRIISYSVEVHRRYQNDMHITVCIVGEKCWRLLERGRREKENCQRHGQDSQESFV